MTEAVEASAREGILHALRARWIFPATAAAALALDLLSKWVAFLWIPDFPRTGIELVPNFLYLVKSWNPGAAFGIMQGRLFIFLGISVAAIIALFFFSYSAPARRRLQHATLGLVLSGVLGNLYDRVAFGQVRDFIDVQGGFEPLRGFLLRTFGTNHWPTFNVADAAICVGVALILLEFWREERAARREKAAK